LKDPRQKSRQSTTKNFSANNRKRAKTHPAIEGESSDQLNIFLTLGRSFSVGVFSAFIMMTNFRVRYLLFCTNDIQSTRQTVADQYVPGCETTAKFF
jgi:hypothetical protein